MHHHEPLWMFPYTDACRARGLLELDTGDVLDIEWDGDAPRPKLVAPGRGSHRCIVVRIERAWHGYAHKVLITLMGRREEGLATS